MSEPQYPRLLYLGDVPVEASYHGSALLYRLLRRYPAERLKVIEGNLFPARTSRRLAGVGHATLDVGHPRLLNSRVHDWYSRRLLRGAAGRATRVPGLVGSFQPDAVLTVGHGYTWATAAHYAAQAAVPLHFIVHDDWPRIVAAANQAAAGLLRLVPRLRQAQHWPMAPALNYGADHVVAVLSKPPDLPSI